VQIEGPEPSRQLVLLGGIELRGVPGTVSSAILAQPKAVAVLAYLALSPEGRFQRRDRLVALLWPELDQEHARAALRKVVYIIRAALGTQLLLSRGDEELALGTGELWCDVVEFTARADEGQIVRALQLYRGELMPGFHVAGCADLDAWLDERRSDAKERAAAAAWTLACRLETDQKLTEAGKWARLAVRYTGNDERVLRRALRMLDRIGDRAGALHMYDDFVRRLRQAFDAEPSEETRTLAASLKQ
jgi:DNA-binding SARP family transcriptional activator